MLGRSRTVTIYLKLTALSRHSSVLTKGGFVIVHLMCQLEWDTQVLRHLAYTTLCVSELSMGTKD